jgi:hypothetical protein
MLKRLFSYFAIVMLMFTALITLGCGDNVTFDNSPGNEHGLLVDGQSSSGHVNDRARVGTSTTLDVGKLDASSSTNDIIAFTQGRPVAIKDNALWTSGKDAESITFSNKINIPITVWIVKGPFSSRRTKAINACIYTVGRFDAERVGVGFSEFEIIDKTGITDASDYYHFATNADPQDWKDDVGWKNDRINIYYLETVSGSATTGRAVGFSNFIVLGQNFGNIAVVHEVGHSFSARHKSAPDFNTETIMWPTYDTTNPWEYFTEGELYRMHVNTTSALNSVYNARPGQLQRNNIGNVSSDEAVDWDKRLWDDGSLLAN